MNEQFDHWNYFVTVGQTKLGKNKLHNKLFGKQAPFWPKIYILPTYSVIFFFIKQAVSFFLEPNHK